MSEFKSWVPGASLVAFPNPGPATLYDCARAGIGAVEVFARHMNRENAPLYVKAAQETGIDLWSVHLNFYGEVDISRLDEYGEQTMQMHEEFLRLAADSGFRVAVVHPSAEPLAEADRRVRLERSRENLMRLASFAKALGMRLAVEDLPRTCLGHSSDEINYLLTGNPDLNVCFDTNHLTMEDNVHFVRRLGSRIITLHVSDYDLVDERHLLPGEGKNNWKGIIAALEEAGYCGPWMNELTSKRGYVPADILTAKNRLLEATL